MPDKSVERLHRERDSLRIQLEAAQSALKETIAENTANAETVDDLRRQLEAAEAELQQWRSSKNYTTGTAYIPPTILPPEEEK